MLSANLRQLIFGWQIPTFGPRPIKHPYWIVTSAHELVYFPAINRVLGCR